MKNKYMRLSVCTMQLYTWLEMQQKHRQKVKDNMRVLAFWKPISAEVILRSMLKLVPAMAPAPRGFSSVSYMHTCLAEGMIEGGNIF